MTNDDVVTQTLLASAPMIIAGRTCQLRLVRFTGITDGVEEKEFQIVLTAPYGHVVLDTGYTLEEGISFYVGYQLEDAEVLTKRLVSAGRFTATVVKEVAG